MNLEISVSKNDGLADVKTLAQAIKIANEKRNDYDEIVINIAEGEYFQNETLELTEKELKSARAKIIFKGNGDKKTIISGGIELSPFDFKIAENDRIRPDMKGKILSLDLKKYGITEVGKPFTRDSWYDMIPSQCELFVDDCEAQITSFPKNRNRIKINKEDILRTVQPLEPYPAPYDPKPDISDKCAVIKYNFFEADKWSKAHDAYLFGFPNAGFFSFSVPVDIDTKEKTISLKERVGVGSNSYFNTYCIRNLLEELTEKGEYYIDSDELILYYYPKTKLTKDSKIRLSSLKEPLIACENIFNVKFENIVFECTRGMGVYMEDTKHVEFSDCTFRNIGLVAVSFGLGFETTINIPKETMHVKDYTDLPFKKRAIGNIKTQMHNDPMSQRNGGYDNLIRDCEIYNIGCGGIILDGGDRMNLLRGNNRIVGCDIHDFNRLEEDYRPGVGVFGCGNTVSFCKIYNAPQQGFCVVGNDNTVEYCEIFNCCTDNYDNGACYCGSCPPARNSFNTVIRGNYFHDNGSENCPYNEGAKDFRSETYDIYLDGYPATTLVNNIFIGSAVHTAVFLNQGANYCTVDGNVFIDVSGVFHREQGIDSYDPFKEYNMTEKQTEKWKTAYPQIESYIDMTKIDKGHHIIINNTHVGKGNMLVCSSNVHEYENNTHYDKMPKFLKVLIKKLDKQ